jgi:hypothetical protein
MLREVDEVITDGRLPDRRIGKTYTSTVQYGTPALAIHEPDEADLNDDEQRLAVWLSRHWLVQLGAGAQLSPPDPRLLPPEPRIEDVWHGLAARDEMADGEVAIQVASAFEKSPPSRCAWKGKNSCLPSPTRARWRSSSRSASSRGCGFASKSRRRRIFAAHSSTP